MVITTRFAPSPTGELHIGGARTALFEYLFAKHNKGKFLLRIEDTDRDRFVEGSTGRIIESLKWLGIMPDNLENIVYQSQRLDLYKKYALKLVDEGKAYICTCSKEKLAESREKQQKEGKSPKYESFCRDANIKVEEVKEPYVIRLKMPQKGKIIIKDMIRGDVEFDLSLFDDQVLLKSDGYPTYHLASVVDDHEMRVNYVIRAEEWLSSTPKHLVLYKMFDWEAPKFAHLPMVLAPDRTKLSKRHGATSVVEYKNLGYLPEAIDNFLVLQGWNPKDEREEFSMTDLIAEFKLENVNKSPAVFDINKLNSINEKYLMARGSEKLRIELKDFGLTDANEGEIAIVKRGGFKTLKDAADYILALRKEPEYDKNLLVFKRSDRENTLLALKEVKNKLSKVEKLDANEGQRTLEYVE
jgi:glutamyl-tRNA synthetase